MTGAPIVPVFAVRTAAGVELRLHAPIRVGEREPFPRVGVPGPALVTLAGAIAEEVGAHPDQWLELSPRFGPVAGGG